MKTKIHPAERFTAPSSIMKGSPLKEVFSPELVKLIGESFAAVHPEFNRRRFERAAVEVLDSLEFNERGRHIGLTLASELPSPFSKASPILLASLGPELKATAANGLAPFFYHPHGHLVAETGIKDFSRGMKANYELTKRFTSEFSIRPFIAQYLERSMKTLLSWTADKNPHVRRLVSEGTRPRLPWAMRLRDLQQDPKLALPLLERLKNDSELYVRRSVANHLGDVLKDHPDFGFKVCERWLREVSNKSTPSELAKQRKWIIRHAVRLPAKKGDKRALSLRVAAK